MIRSIRRARLLPLPWFDDRFQMLGALAKKIFGSANDRRLKAYRPKVAAINALEPELEALSDDELRARTESFRAELAAGKTLDDILVPAFATVREAAKRTLGQRHFDVQLIGGMVLHEGAHRRDEDRRRQDARRDPAGLSQRARRQGRARRHRQRLPRPPRRRVDGPDLQLPRPHGRRHRARARRRRAQPPPTPATSPTAPTTSTASTICATT